MRYLFLDNFRGFSNAIVPIADVNFLVGENSSGKTSFLTVLKLLSHPPSYMGLGMGEEENILGHFSEMVSAHSSDRSYFRLGMMHQRPGKKDKSAVSGLLLSYRDIPDAFGLPQVSNFTCITGDTEITLRFSDDGVLFKKRPAPTGVDLAVC